MSTAGNSSQVERLETQIRAVVGQSGSVQPIEGLRRNGVEQIRVVSQSQLAQTIQLAINRTLRRELDGIDVSPAARETIEERAFQEFRRLVENGVETEREPAAPPPVAATPPPPPPEPEPEPEPQPTPAPETLSTPEATTTPEPVAELDPPTSLEPASQLAPESTVESASAAGIDPGALREALSRGQRPIAPQAPEIDLEALEKRMSQQISSLLANDLRNELAAVENSQREQVELLESRISKLARALESTDELLARIQEPRGAVAPTRGADPAQSPPAAELDPASPLFERKSQLLDALFQANLTLRELRGDQAIE